MIYGVFWRALNVNLRPLFRIKFLSLVLAFHFGGYFFSFFTRCFFMSICIRSLRILFKMTLTLSCVGLELIIDNTSSALDSASS